MKCAFLGVDENGAKLVVGTRLVHLCMVAEMCFYCFRALAVASGAVDVFLGCAAHVCGDRRVRTIEGGISKLGRFKEKKQAH